MNCKYKFSFAIKKNVKILALGGESAGNFSIYNNGEAFLSDDFGDLLIDENYDKFEKTIKVYLEEENFKPDFIICDLHPLFKTTDLGKRLSKDVNAKFIQVQHHFAHIFAVLGEKLSSRDNLELNEFIGIACDGTGLGFDENIWGGEIFSFSINNGEFKYKRIGKLEDQVLIGGELAIREPARVLIAILSKFLNKTEIYKFVKEYYDENVFNLLFSQNEQKFNCIETSSMGRVLDASSLFLGFCKNERGYKHEPIDLLEKNSTQANNIQVKIEESDEIKILFTTNLFKYLVDNFDEDHKRLAASVQMYLAKGLYKMIEDYNLGRQEIFFGGGIANNKIISAYLIEKGVIVNKKIPRGDAGLSFGQVIYGLLALNG